MATKNELFVFVKGPMADTMCMLKESAAYLVPPFVLALWSVERWKVGGRGEGGGDREGDSSCGSNFVKHHWVVSWYVGLRSSVAGGSPPCQGFFSG